MSTEKRRRKQVCSTLDPELWNQLKSLSEETRIPATRYFDEAVEDLLLKYQRIDCKTKTP